MNVPRRVFPSWCCISKDISLDGVLFDFPNSPADGLGGCMPEFLFPTDVIHSRLKFFRVPQLSDVRGVVCSPSEILLPQPNIV